MEQQQLFQLNNKTQKYKDISQVYNGLFSLPIPKFYGSLPVSMLSESIIDIVKRRTDNSEYVYNVTPKLDGVRLLLLIHPSTGIVFINRSLDYFVFNKNIQCDKIYLFDGELVHGNRYFIFDILYSDNTSVVDYDFETRYGIINGLVLQDGDFIQNIKIPMYNVFGFEIYRKLYMNINGFDKQYNLYDVIKTYFTEHYNIPLEFDGLIFTPRFTKYILGDGGWKYPGNILYKWKPYQQETIDFGVSYTFTGMIRNRNTMEEFRVPEEFETFLKSKTIKIENPRKIHIEHKKVYECVFNYDKNVFEIERLRSDKRFPNSYRTTYTALKLLKLKLDINIILPIITSNYKTDEELISIIERYGIPSPKWQIMQMSKDFLIPLNDSMITRYNNQTRKDSLEMEIRIGKRTKHGFEVPFDNYDWLMKSMDTANIQNVYLESIDVFTNTYRTSYYLDTYKTIKKHSQDMRDYFKEYGYGYPFRMSISTEETISTPMEYAGVNVYDVIKTGVYYRIKKRKTYFITQNYHIDMTEYTSKNSVNKVKYQVEIEKKMNNDNIDVYELNYVLKYVLSFLYANSEIL